MTPERTRTAILADPGQAIAIALVAITNLTTDPVALRSVALLGEHPDDAGAVQRRFSDEVAGDALRDIVAYAGGLIGTTEFAARIATYVWHNMPYPPA